MEQWKHISSKKRRINYLRSIWVFREFFLFLLWRDILVRYKQTAFGLLWAFLRPLLNTVIFALVFGVFAKLPSSGVPYPLFALAGVIPWQLVSSSMMETTTTLMVQAGLLKKVYFPRIFLPASLVFLNSLDAFLGLLFFIPVLFFYGYLKISFFLFPFLMIWAFVLALGIGLWLSSYSLVFQDFKVITPFLIQIGLFLSPIGYSSNLIPLKVKWLYSLNPMVGIIDSFRYIFLGIRSSFLIESVLLSLMMTILIVISGFLVFKTREKTFADWV